MKKEAGRVRTQVLVLYMITQAAEEEGPVLLKMSMKMKSPNSLKAAETVLMSSHPITGWSFPNHQDCFQSLTLFLHLASWDNSHSKCEANETTKMTKLLQFLKTGCAKTYTTDKDTGQN